jgi:hypothetical protein
MPLRTVIDETTGQTVESEEVGFGQEARSNKTGHIYQIGIPGKSREALVRGVATSSGTQWTDLPVPHVGIGKKIDEPSSFLTQSANTHWPGK